ncbi:AFL230Wp [Eremothecium gossypii ATCC 10895]|uniref:AFL230Wp n=1 Tax=Eremothecium gossypii (strain ATCC 10895 / CBS 109.51 / FGSC 9923 / NRRL Y-1056) TaxID=284811 RepID=Q755P3_EREGS|nr:AFL230Wp [Eremothecium gossypii ATCC 10895]AAS53144.1 AFL230Wp [Eremothecium gossypii ATCC 10895]AEY97454.1 FAFL230Wp [Eremothecium gossypii FDAG1]
METIPTLQDLLQGRQRDASGHDGASSTLLMFHEFLRRTHCDENLQFVLMTDGFVAEQADPPVDPGVWNQIYDTFIRRDSPKECNFPESIRSVFDDSFQRQVVPQQEHIVRARKHVLKLLEDAYTKFHRQLVEQGKSCGKTRVPRDSASSSSSGRASLSSASAAPANATPGRPLLMSPAESAQALVQPEFAVSDGEDDSIPELISSPTSVDRMWYSRQLAQIPTKRVHTHVLQAPDPAPAAQSALLAPCSPPQAPARSPNEAGIPHAGSAAAAAVASTFHSAHLIASPLHNAKIRGKKQLFSKFKFGRRSSSSGSLSN